MTVSGKLVLALIFGLTAACTAFAYYALPPLPPPDRYGDILMDRVASANGAKAVLFSHWSHRTRFSCRVCHLELAFQFTAGQTEVTEERSRAGEFCGACHDGRRAFGHTSESCERCHTGPDVDRSDAFRALRQTLPPAPFGNKIDWGVALREGLISPSYSLFSAGGAPMAFDERLELEAEWAWVPPAVFDHAAHTPWLDCANCHPDLFNIQKKTTEHFLMEYILEKKFCGVCHFSVALPIDDCHACHPAMKSKY